MITNIQSQNTFTGKSPLPRRLKQVKQIFRTEFKDIKSPARYEMLPLEKQQEMAQEIKALSDRLIFLRKFSRSFFDDGGNFEVFRGLIGCVRTFKVGNCAEFAEIGKTISKMNNLKNCDIFTLHAKAPDGTIRTLDQTVLAFKVPKSKNNITTKQNGTMFEPSNDIPILDLWIDGFVGKVKQAKRLYEVFGLTPQDKLLFKPERTYEPTITSIEKLKKEFPNLMLKETR